MITDSLTLHTVNVAEKRTIEIKNPLESVVNQLKWSKYNFENPINVRVLDNDKNPRLEKSYNLKNKDELKQLEKLIQKASSDQGFGHVYYIPNNSDGFLIENVKNCQMFFAEFDDIPKIEQFKKVAQLPPFNYAVETLKSIHFYWVLENPLPIDEWVEGQKKIIEILGSDKSIVNPNRLMRLSGVKYASSGFDVILLKNKVDAVYKDSDFGFNVKELTEVSKQKKAEKLEKNSLNKVDLEDSKYGINLPISDLTQLIAENLEDLYDWEGHNFKDHGQGKWQGDCPFHDSHSKTSFWVEINDNGTYSWACPTCTGNEKKNLLFYQNWLLFGKQEQPRGRELGIIERHIQQNLIESRKEANMNTFDFSDINALQSKQLEEKKYSNTVRGTDPYSLVKKRENNLHEIALEYCERIPECFPGKPLDTPRYIEWIAEAYAIDPRQLLAAVQAVQEEKHITRVKEELEQVFGGSPAVPYVVPGWIPDNALTMVSAAPGTGKSSLVGDLIATAIEPGREFLGEEFKRSEDDQRHKVLYICPDEPLKSIQTRFARLDFSEETKEFAKENMRVIPSLKDLKNQVEQIELEIVQLNNNGDKDSQCKLVVIDSLSSSTSSTTDFDENSSKSADILYKLSDLADKYNTSVVLLHHNNKLGDVSGSGRLLAPCHHVYNLTAKTEEDLNNPSNMSMVRSINCIKNRTGKRFGINIEMNKSKNWKNKGIFSISDFKKNEKAVITEVIKQSFINSGKTYLSVTELEEINPSFIFEKLFDHCELMEQRGQLSYNQQEDTYCLSERFLKKIEQEMISPKNEKPEVIESEVIEPEVIEPEVIESEVIEPEVIESEVIESEVIEPEVIETIQVEDKIKITECIDIDSDLSILDVHIEKTDENLDEDEKSVLYGNYVLEDGSKLRHNNLSDDQIDKLFQNYEPYNKLQSHVNIAIQNMPSMLDDKKFLDKLSLILLECIKDFDLEVIIRNTISNDDLFKIESRLLSILRQNNLIPQPKYEDSDEPIEDPRDYPLAQRSSWGQDSG
jgi:hypothetical protein